MDTDDNQNPRRPPIRPPPPANTAAFPTPSPFPLPLSVASPFPEPPPFSPFISFDPFESKPDLGSELGGTAGGVTAAPQPLESLYETPVPPFLSKTFDLVDDSSLDAIISWSAKGDSFVVWDHVEFARTILPRNFKHNNFSSFVRQLNTYGFRKVDTDKWEFANEGFIKGQRHLLKTIQRRRSIHSQQIGSSSGPSNEVGKAAVEGEIEQLRRERSLMMQEVIELQQQQRGTIQHMEMVNEKLQTAERRQKQMVSFLGKIFQNPSVLARLQQTRDQKSIASPRSTRKFVKNQAHEPGGTSGSSPKGQIVKYQHGLSEEPSAAEQLPGLPPVFGTENVPFQVDDNVLQSEFAMVNEFLGVPAQGNPTPSLGTGNPVYKGKGIVGPMPQSEPKHFISFPDLAKEKSGPGFSIPGSESMDLGGSLWSAGFEAGAGISSSTDLWGNVSNYDVAELGGLSDIWDIGSLQLSGIENWPIEDSPFNEFEKQEGQRRDNSSEE